MFRLVLTVSAFVAFLSSVAAETPKPTEARPKASVSPPPTSAPSKVDPKAAAILERMLEVAGGREALDKAVSLYGKGTSTIVTPIGDRTAKVTYYVRKPGHLRMDQDFGGMSFSMAFSPGKGWLRQGSGILAMPKAMLDAVSEEDARTDLELRYKKEDLQVRLIGEQMIQDKPCYVIEFEDAQKRQTQYAIERKTHRLLRRSYIGVHPLSQMKTEIVSLFGDYKAFTIPGTSKAIQIATTVESYMGGSKSSRLVFESIEVNSKKVTDRVFRMPNPAD